MAHNKKLVEENKIKEKDKYVQTSVNDYQFHGYKIRPPKREQEQRKTAVQEVVKESI